MLRLTVRYWSERRLQKRLTLRYAGTCSEGVSSVAWVASASRCVVDDPALSVDPTDSRTGVDTVESNTGQTGWTLCVDGALRSTCYIGVSEILGYATACSSPISSRADCILPTGRWVARIYRSWCWGWNKYLYQHHPSTSSQTLTSGDSHTANEGVPSVSRVTATLGNMVGDPTGGVVATDPGTRVHTVLGHTGEVPGTLSVNNTLGFTLDIWVSPVVSDTGAAGSLAELSTEGINPTGRGVAGLHYDWQDGAWWQVATGERVANIALVTHTDGNVISDPAVGIHTTEAGTGILTLSVDTCPVCGTVVVDLTLRSAVGRRAQHLRQTVALTPGAHHSWGFAVWSTGIWVAGVLCHNRLH